MKNRWAKKNRIIIGIVVTTDTAISWFQRVPARFESQPIVLKDDRAVGFNMLGGRWNHEPLLEWIHERRGLDHVLKRLHEAQFDEEFTRRFEVQPGATLEAG